MQSSETLKDALTQAGDTQYVSLLTPEAQNLTKAEITDFMNNSTDQNLSTDTIHSLRKFAKQRMADGKSIFPYASMDGLEDYEADGNTGGVGTW